MVLSALPGVGERLAKKMTDHFGSEEAALSSLKSGDIGQIAEIEGVSPKRALALARSIAGDDGQFLATKEAVKLHQQLIDQIANFTASPATKSRLQLLTPLDDSSKRRESIQSAMDFFTKHSDIGKKIAESFKQITSLKSNSERYDRVVVTKQPMDELKKYCRVLTPAESVTWKDYSVFNKVTWLGSGAPNDIPDGWIVLGSNPEQEVIIPEMTLDWFKKNRKTLTAVSEIITMFCETPISSPFIDYINSGLMGLEQLPELLFTLFEEGDTERAELVKDELWTYCKELENEVNIEVEKAMNDAKLALSGAELLDALADGSGFQRRLKEATGYVIENAMQQAVNRLSQFMEGSGVRCPPVIFTSDWPAKLDRQVIEKIDESLEKRISAQKSDHIYSMARKLGPLKVKCESAVRSLMQAPS